MKAFASGCLCLQLSFSFSFVFSWSLAKSTTSTLPAVFSGQGCLFFLLRGMGEEDGAGAGEVCAVCVRMCVCLIECKGVCGVVCAFE